MNHPFPLPATLLATTAMLATAAPATAFPMFARKYETSCQTCHVAIPKLNHFGVAFRNNGYEWPGGEEEMVKDRPVTLSAEANKEAFPRTLWPSWLPRTPPISILMVNELRLSPEYPKWVSPEGLGTDIELGLGGAIASGVAARGDVTLVVDGATGSVRVGIEQAFMDFHPLGTPHLDVRVGKLWPELFSFAPQTLGGDYWLYARRTGAGPFQLAGRQGLEVRSILAAGRVRLVAGTAGSEGDFGGYFDAWGRVGVKLGGARLDGVESGNEGQPATSAQPSRPWRDDSIQISAFAYHGRSRFTLTPPATGLLPEPAPVELFDEFTHAGGDVDVWLGDANLVAAFVIGHHSHLALDLPPRLIYLAMAQLDYVVFPWLVPSLRFEWTDDARYLSYSTSSPRWHALAGLNFLLIANVRAYVYAEAGPDAAGDLAFLSGKVGLFTAY